MQQATHIDNAEKESQAATPSGLELVISKGINPVQVFTANGLDPILERIETETRSIVLDISTKKGREQIASLAHKVAKSKTALDAAGKELVAGWKEQAKKVDVERARAWDRLDALQKDVRQPLTDWEDLEKGRVATHEANIAEIVNAGIFTAGNWQTLSVEVMSDRLAEIRRDKFDWQEFSVNAKHATETAIASITAAIETRQKHDAEQAELARLRKEETERKQREHEEKLKSEAAEKARIAAEEKAWREAEAEAKRVAAEREKADQDRLRIEYEKDQAEARARKAEEEKKAGVERAERERVAAAEMAKREKDEAEARAVKAENDRIAADAKAKENARIAAEKADREKKAAEEAAIVRERQRIEAEQKAEADAKTRREADKAHRTKVNTEALHVLKNLVDEPTAKAIIGAIAKGRVPHIAIAY